MAGSLSPIRAPFVGRTTELDAMRTSLRGLAHGHGALFLLTGEPGIGKTRLADELAGEATAVGVRVFWGRCYELEGRPPYWPWIQIIQGHLRTADPAAVARTMGEGAAPLGQLLPELRPHWPPSAVDATPVESERARFLLFRATVELLRSLTAPQPILLVLDDLHWADMPSLLLLEYLALELADLPLLVVGTYRRAEVSQQAAVEALMGRLCRVGHEVRLSGLSVDETAHLVATATGHTISLPDVERVHEQTQGNPFFLDEVARLFRDGGAWFGAGGTSLPISQGVRGAIRQRVAPLERATRELLAVASVVGRDFDLALLEVMTDTPRATLLARLEPALEAEVVTPSPAWVGQFRFAHALVRDTIYGDLATALRVTLHRRCAEALVARGGDDLLAEIAHHYYEAAAEAGETLACEFAERVGRQAIQALAYEDAAMQFGRALHLADLGADVAPERKCDLLLACGAARNCAGHTADAAAVFRKAATLARRLGSGALLARAATGLSDCGSAWSEHGRFDEAVVRLLREALDVLDSSDAVLRARLTARLATELCWSAPLEEIRVLGEEAVVLARAAGDRHDLAYALVARVHCAQGIDHVAERAAWLHEILDLTDGRGDLAVDAYLWLHGDALHLGSPAESAECRHALIRAVRDLRQPNHAWLIGAIQGQRALLEGRYVEAAKEAIAILDEQVRPTNAEHAASALLFLVQRDQGRAGELAAGLQALADQSPALAVWRCALALLYAESGQYDAARGEVLAVFARGVDAVRRDVDWPFTIACLAEACRRCGTPEQIAALYDALAPYDGRNIAVGPLYYMGPVSYYLGVLAHAAAQHDVAVGHLERAVAETREFDAHPYLVRSLSALATALAAGMASDPARARVCRAEAREWAARLGMAGIDGLADPAPAAAVDEAIAPEWRAILANHGAHWLVEYRGRQSRVKAMKGLTYLVHLLADPGRAMHVLELVAAVDPPNSPAGGRSAPTLDATTKKALQEEATVLRDEVEEAEAHHDVERARRARAALEQLGENLARRLGLGGRDDDASASAERARARVTKAIRAAIGVVAEHDPALGAFLSRTIRTGALCSYDPLPDVQITWELPALPRA